MIHLTNQQISAFLDGEQDPSLDALAQRHLEECDTCSWTLVSFSTQDDALERALRREPDDAVLDRITRGLTERVDPSGRVPASRTAGEPEPEARPRGFPVPWGVILIIGTVLGSVGAVNIGMEYVPRWLSGSDAGNRLLRAATADLSVAEALAPSMGDPTATAPPPGIAVLDTVSVQAPPFRPRPDAAPVNARPEARPPEAPPTAPGRRAAALRAAAMPGLAAGPIEIPGPVHADAVPEAAAPKPAKAAADSFVTVGEGALGAVRAARDREREAERHPTPGAYDAAAEQWERALPLLHGDANREVRLRAAEARYRAWLLEPGSDRASSADAAIRAYLDDAPAGTDREEAIRWLLQVEEGR